MPRGRKKSTGQSSSNIESLKLKVFTLSDNSELLQAAKDLLVALIEGGESTVTSSERKKPGPKAGAKRGRKPGVKPGPKPGAKRGRKPGRPKSEPASE